MEYREIEAETLEDAKFKIKKEFGDRARIIKIIESSKGGFFGLGSKKNVKVLISISDVDLLKKYKENLGIHKIKTDPELSFVKESSINNSAENFLSLSVIMDKLNCIESQIGSSPNENKEEKEHDNLIEVKDILKENEFSDDFIDSVISSIKENLSYTKIDNKGEVHRFVYDFIKKEISIYDERKTPKEKRAIVLVGPTGVGKTTTIAKIAANAIREKLKVELITIDGFRIGAKYQLEKYAEYMRTPVSGVEDNMELQKIIDLSDADLILIDTIGRSATDDMNLVKMKQMLKISRCRTEFVLTISASTKVKDVERIFKNFNMFDYESIIITKLDESESIGGIVDSAILYKKQIKYITTGQRVPNDIEKATKNNIMAKIKGLELEVYINNV